MMRDLVCSTIVFILVVFTNTVKGQSSVFKPDEKIPASPIAASYSKYGGFSDDLYTGNVSVSIPIYAMTDNDVSLPVSLNTRTGSIRVSEIPGWVGSGWNLSTGGVITRSINHLPDDLYLDGQMEVGYFYNTSLHQEIDSLISNQIPLPTGLADALTNGSLDMTPDEFTYNIPGYSGSFSYVLGELVVYPKMNIKVERIDNVNEHYAEGWVITTPEGLKYTFISLERSEKEFRVGPNTHECLVATTWYLEKIESLKLGGGEIDIHYKELYGERAIKCVQNIWDTWYWTEEDVEKNWWNAWLRFSGTYNNPWNYVNSEDQINIIPIHYIDSIVTTNSRLIFSASQIYNFQNQEYKNDQSDWKLDTIKLYDRNRELVKMWILDYGSSVNYDRIQLDQVIEKSSDLSLEKKYSLDYYGTLGDISFSSRNIDHWGYYNYSGHQNLTLLPEPLYTNGTDSTRDGNFSAGLLGALKRITYPTGGYSEFIYESHDYSYINDASYERNVVSYEPDTAFSFSKSYFTGNEYPISYALSGTSRIDISYRCTSQDEETYWLGNPCGCGDYWAPFDEAPLGEVTPFIVNSGSITFNESFFANYIPIYDEWGSKLDSLIFEVNIYNQVSSSETCAPGGGIRLKEIINYDGEKNESKNYYYRLVDDPERSSGVIGSYPKYVFDARSWLEGNAPIYFRSGTGLSEISCTQGSYIGYSVVSELINDSIRTDYYYTTFKDFEDLNVFDAWFGAPLPEVFLKKVSRDYLRGKLKRKIMFVENQKLHSSEYCYSTHATDTIIKWSSIFKTVPDTEVALCLFNRGGIISETLTLDSSIEIDYDINSVTESPIILDTTFFSYTPLFDLRSKLRRSSIGVVQSTENTYPYDYENDTIFQDWIENSHIYNTIISESKYLDTNFIEANVNIYQSYNPSAIIRRSTFGGNILIDTLIYFDQWAGINQPVQFKERGAYSSSIWDEIDDNIIAQFDNAKRSQVYFESFEHSSISNTIKNAVNARSGESYLNSGTFSIPGSAFMPEYGIDYQMIYWYFKAGIGWKRVVTSFNSSITTDGSRLDDVVICPTTAQFTTYTYKPLVGMTSKTDSNGITLYYDYDSLGRLMFIRDYNHKIIKYFKYNYKE